MSLECVKNHEEISQNEQYYHVAAWIGVWVSEEYIVLQPLLRVVANRVEPGFERSSGENGRPIQVGTSSQCERYCSKWLIQLMCREPLSLCCTSNSYGNYQEYYTLAIIT